MSKAKIASWDQISRIARDLHQRGKRIVFSNGCFDLLHAGHVEYLEQARDLGDVLIIGLNSDASVQRLKGKHRPIVPQDERALVLAALESVDYVVVFEQDTPYELIRLIEPDILVKGGDWPVEEIVGSDIVVAKGGRVHNIYFREGVSTTAIIDRILKSNRSGSSQRKV